MTHTGNITSQLPSVDINKGKQAPNVSPTLPQTPAWTIHCSEGAETAQKKRGSDTLPRLQVAPSSKLNWDWRYPQEVESTGYVVKSPLWNTVNYEKNQETSSLTTRE